MAFQVSLEEEPIHKVRTDPTPYRQAIEQGKESGKTVAVIVPTEEAAKVVTRFRNIASPMNVGLRFDNPQDLGNGTTKIRFACTTKRKFDPSSVEKRKETMRRNKTKAGRKATTKAS